MWLNSRSPLSAASRLTSLPTHSCQINLPKYFFIMSLLCSKSFNSCSIPTAQSPHSLAQVLSPLHNLVAIFFSWFISHSSLTTQWSLWILYSSLHNAVAKTACFLLFLFFSQAVHWPGCSAIPLLYSATSWSTSLDDSIHGQVGLPVQQMQLGSVWECKLHASSTCMLICLSRVWLFVTPWTAAHQAPLSMGFSLEEHEWVAMPSSRGSSQPRDQICVSCIGRWVLYH